MSTQILAFALLTLFASTAQAKPASDTAARAGVEAFNHALSDGTKRMDNAALSALWEEDGITLLPATAPIKGRAAITKFVADAMASMPGAKMVSFDLKCADIEIYGDWASEWCTEHQIVNLGAGKPPFDGVGKLLFVLHKGADGVWRLRREMWNQGIKS